MCQSVIQQILGIPYRGNVESIQVKTTVDDDKTIAFNPTGGISGAAANSESEKASSLVRIVS